MSSVSNRCGRAKSRQSHSGMEMEQVEQWELEDLLGKQDEDEQSSKLKKYAKLILPHIGLILLSCFYIVAGAAIFLSLEYPHEIDVKKRNLRTIGERRTEFLQGLWQISKTEISENSWREKAITDVDNITKLLFSAFDTHYITAHHLNRNSTTTAAWTFPAAIFFTSTLLTTIGYGNLVPVTFQGRMFCICYGLFGVPLILITVADIGKFLSENIVWLYCRYVEMKKKCRKKKSPTRHISTSQRCENETTGEEGIILKLPDTLSQGDHEDEDEQQSEIKEELEKFGLDDYIAIPVSLVLLILVGYITIGALLLGYLENWNFFSAFYFSFITMTTVGFGDLVPINESYFFLDLLYIIVGLAITTMCIDLVGIQYIRKIHYFGRAIQDARYALVNVGGRMVHVGDLMKYASVLHRKYGLNDPRAHVIENPSAQMPDAYIPRDAKYMKYIDCLRHEGFIGSPSIPSFHGRQSCCSNDTSASERSAAKLQTTDADEHQCNV